MKVTVQITDRSLQRRIAHLNANAPAALGIVAKTAAAQGKEYARDNITVQIYATPERSGYDRTRMLIRSIYSDTRRQGGGWIITVGASAEYAAYNEFGTYDGYDMIGGDDGAEDRIIADARRVRGEITALEYGSVERGLEPRPYILPALVRLDIEMPALVSDALDRLI